MGKIIKVITMGNHGDVGPFVKGTDPDSGKDIYVLLTESTLFGRVISQEAKSLEFSFSGTVKAPKIRKGQVWFE